MTGAVTECTKGSLTTSDSFASEGSEADRTKITHLKGSRAVWLTARKHFKTFVSTPPNAIGGAPRDEDMNNKLFSRINAPNAKPRQVRLHRRSSPTRREQLIAIAGEATYCPDNAEAAREDLWREDSGDESLGLLKRSLWGTEHD
jgi:hypothetical protein